MTRELVVDMTTSDSDPPPLSYHSTTSNTPTTRLTHSLGGARTRAPEEEVLSVAAAVSNHPRNGNLEGMTIKQLIQLAPEKVVAVLRNHAVKELKRFSIKESEALLAFGRGEMLTRGSSTIEDCNCEQSWRALIAAKAAAKPNRRNVMEDNWDQQVTVVACAVTIKHPGAVHSDGLLRPLLQKSLSGLVTKESWAFDAVQAVIEYKWRHWAWRYLFVEFALYLGWVISYSIFLYIYIDTNISRDDPDPWSKSHINRPFAYAFDALSMLFMLPFLLVEYNTLVYYGRTWLQLWNLLDVFTFVLQVYITYVHFLAAELMDSSHYNTVLAVQCTFLYVKVQSFSRLFGSGSSFVQSVARVIRKMYEFLTFIILAMISAALSFTVLYREDTAKTGGDDTTENFGSVERTIVTLLTALLGEFDLAYIFSTSNRFVKGTYFVCFLVTMSLTVLNLLIAVMTQAFGDIVSQERIMNSMGRAQLMEELEIALPKAWGPRLKPYCHFLVIDTESKTLLGRSLREGSSSRERHECVLNREMLNLKKCVQECNERIQMTRKEIQELKAMMQTLLDRE